MEADIQRRYMRVYFGRIIAITRRHTDVLDTYYTYIS